MKKLWPIGVLACVVSLLSFVMFQNCSNHRFTAQDEIGSVLRTQTVFGDDASATPSRDGGSVVGVDSRGRPIVVTLDDPSSLNTINITGTCLNCKDLDSEGNGSGNGSGTGTGGGTGSGGGTGNPIKRVIVVVNGVCTNCTLTKFPQVRVINGQCVNCPSTSPERVVVVNGRCVNCTSEEQEVTINGYCVTCMEDGEYIPADKIVCRDDKRTKPEECEPGTKYVRGQCINICPKNQIFVNGVCTPRTRVCDVEGGKGQQFWASNSYGICIAESCYESKGYYLKKDICVHKCDLKKEVFYQGQCYPITVDCKIAHGVSYKKWMGTGYGKCVLTSCDEAAGYFPKGDVCQYACPQDQAYYNKQCYPRVRPCTVPHGSGTESWMGTAYSGKCDVNQCEDGYYAADYSCKEKCNTAIEVFYGGKCNPKVDDCPIVNGAGKRKWLGTSYGQCEVVSCDTARGYIASNNQCVPMCNPATHAFYNGSCRPLTEPCPVPNGTGIHTWMGSSYGQCVVTSCNPGTRAVGSTCEPICKSNQVFVNNTCIETTVSCPITDGWGTQSWEGSSYGRCILGGCNAGFTVSGNSCTPEVVAWSGDGGGDGGGGDPLIIDLGNSASKIGLSSQLKGILFDLLGTFAKPAHEKKLLSWTSNPRYQYLVLPKQGKVEGIDELFGDNTVGPDGKGARDGFMALMKYDGKTIDGKSDSGKPDNIIDEKDPVYHQLALWSDANRDGLAQSSEMKSLVQMGIESINLNYDGNFYEVDRWGNTTTFKSSVKFKDGRSSLIFDLWFRYYSPISKNCYKL